MGSTRIAPESRPPDAAGSSSTGLITAGGSKRSGACCPKAIAWSAARRFALAYLFVVVTWVWP
ncbi:MAG TPA: hypothetical protein VF765_31280, partial [Polyangiaceae bacterium]